MTSTRWSAAAVERVLRRHQTGNAVTIWAGEEPITPITLVLPWPPTLNHRFVPRGGRLAKNPLHIAYAEDAQRAIGLQHRGYAPIQGRLHVVVELHQAGTADIDNFAKDALDCCTAMRVWEDDSQIDHLEMRRFRDGDQPYIKLIIERID